MNLKRFFQRLFRRKPKRKLYLINDSMTAAQWIEMIAAARNDPMGYIDIRAYGMINYAMSVIRNKNGEEFIHLIDRDRLGKFSWKNEISVPPPDHPDCKIDSFVLIPKHLESKAREAGFLDNL